MKRSDEKFIREKLAPLRDVPPRDERAAARGRAKFLSQAQSLAQGVSIAPQRRLNLWQRMFQRKELRPMLTTITAILVAVALTFGGAGATVYAAQDSLPGDALYPLKTTLEDLQLRLADQPAEQMQLLERFTLRRVEEVQTRLEQGEPLPLDALNRLQNQVQSMLQAAAGLPEPAMEQALLQLQNRLEYMEQRMAGWQGANDPQATWALTQALERIRQQRQWLEGGLQEPNQFRLRVNQPEGAGNETAPGGPNENPGGGMPPVTPPNTPVQDGTGPGPGPGAGSPAQEEGNGNGSGPGGGEPQPTCSATPVQDGTGPGPGPGAGGPQPTPQPSSDDSAGGNGGMNQPTPKQDSAGGKGGKP